MLGIGGHVPRGNKAPKARIQWESGFAGGHVPEDTSSGTTLGTLSANDPDGDSVTFSKAADPGNKFAVQGTLLKLNASLDAGSDTSHAVTVRATDSKGAHTERVFTVTVTAVAGHALISSADFVNGVYVLNGEASTLEAMFEENSDWGTFDQSKIVEDVGVRVTGSSGLVRTKFVLTAAAAAPLLPSAGGFTVVMRGSVAFAGANGQSITHISILDLPGFNVEWSCRLGKTQVGDVHFVSGADTTENLTGDAGDAHVARFTMTPTNIAGSVDGNAVSAIAAEDIADNSTATHIGIQVQVFLPDGAGTAILESLEFYAPVDNADLPTLGD